MKIILMLALLAFQFGCQTSPSRDEATPIPPALSPSVPRSEPPRETMTQVPPLGSPTPAPAEPVRLAEKAKVAIILGPGGLRAYAHAGVLQEVHRSKINLVGIGGLEMGALPAALYAMKPQAFEAEWQMMKLKEEDFTDRSLMGGSKAKDLSSWDNFLRTVFGSGRLEDARIPFGCITVQMDRQQAMVVSKGIVSSTLPNCLAFPPLFKPNDRFIAGTDQLGTLVQHFKQKGATHILYVDLLSDRSRPIAKSEETAVVWSLMSASLQSQTAYAAETLKIPLTNDLNQFSSRRDLIAKGKDLSAKSLTNLLQKMGAF